MNVQKSEIIEFFLFHDILSLFLSFSCLFRRDSIPSVTCADHLAICVCVMDRAITVTWTPVVIPVHWLRVMRLPIVEAAITVSTRRPRAADPKGDS